MQWSTLSNRKRGGLLGAAAALMCFVGYFLFLVKLFIIDGWAGIVNTAGSSVGNMLAWVAIYGFLAFMISGAVGMVALPIFYGLGSLIGWIIDAMRRSR